MLKVVSCLVYEHDHTFVMVAAVVCVAGAIMTIQLVDRALRLSSSVRLSWIMLSGMAGGSAIWTTHFVAMLGFRLPMEYAFDPVLTIASLLIAIAFSAGGLLLATGGNKGVPGEC